MFKKFGRRKMVYIFAGILVIALLTWGSYLLNNTQKNTLTYNNFLSKVENGEVDTVYISNDPDMKVKLKDGSIFYTDNPRSENLKEELLVGGIKVEETEFMLSSENALGFFATVILFGVIGYFMVTYTSKQRSGGLKDIATIKNGTETDTHIGFSDVAGNEEAKESLKDVVDFLKNPEKYTRYGARMPRGIIFYGPPGTGKTLMAKAVAGEAGVPFFAMSGSDFVQIYVGVGASRVRSLFKKAREKGKCVIFIDEIDALGKKRNSSASDGGNDEREQTLNALLTEMSGFNDSHGIIVIAATNRFDMIDEALLRPGRFDRHVEVGLPDVNGRYEILKVHVSGKPISPDVNLRKIAEQTVYFSGAMLESMINEAAIFAANRNASFIDNEDIDRAFYTVIAGSEKKDRSSIRDIDRKITAYHEAGHALIAKIVCPENKVSKVTIIPSTKGAGGYTMNIPPDRLYRTKKDMEFDIMISLGGRGAEELVFGEENITTGASGDLEKATEVVLNMVKRFGMNKKAGLISYDVLYRNSFNNLNDDVLKECKIKLDSLYESVKNLLSQNRIKLDNMANLLLEKETLSEEEIESIVLTKA